MRIWKVRYDNGCGDWHKLYVIADNAGLASQFAGNSIRTKALPFPISECDVEISEVTPDEFGGFGHRTFDHEQHDNRSL